MTILIWIAIVLCALYMSYGVLFYGVKHSMSQLAIDWNQPLFTLFIWAETLMVMPKMFVITPENIQWMVFFIAVGLVFLGGAGLVTKSETNCHIAGATIACGFSLVWLGFINPVLLFIPLFITISHGLSKWQWGGEVGIMLAIYVALLL